MAGLAGALTTGFFAATAGFFAAGLAACFFTAGLAAGFLAAGFFDAANGFLAAGLAIGFFAAGLVAGLVAGFLPAEAAHGRGVLVWQFLGASAETLHYSKKCSKSVP